MYVVPRSKQLVSLFTALFCVDVLLHLLVCPLPLPLSASPWQETVLTQSATTSPGLDRVAEESCSPIDSDTQHSWREPGSVCVEVPFSPILLSAVSPTEIPPPEA